MKTLKFRKELSKLILKKEKTTTWRIFDDYVGKTITAKIDRQMGSKHPKYGFIYPINYGYIPDTISGDGEELDCYILGIFEPIESFTGKCIAVIHRLNDNDDKLVLVPQGKHYTNAEIRELTEFQEKFFESIIIN
ncbi:MAG: inorganic pyrophosphatase [Clostridia bacterium]|nr:inorganic pyrophosphatase [Clostridia bacterium]